MCISNFDRCPPTALQRGLLFFISFFNKIFTETYFVPDIILETMDTSVSKGDKNLGLPGAYIPVTIYTSTNNVVSPHPSTKDFIKHLDLY